VGVVGFFQQGGVFMYPIVAVLVIGAAIAVERYSYLSAADKRNHKLWRQLLPMVKAGNYRTALNAALRSDAAIGGILAHGLSQLDSTSPRDDIERALEESLLESLPRLEQRTHYLAISASIATLLGLLGTIIGLIHAFTAVAAANPAEKADLLSASISVAMNTTAFGLMVAIPLLLAHTILESKTKAIIDGLETAALKFLNAITDVLPARQPAAAED
jgi:biopolymer transport protein ExbB